MERANKSIFWKRLSTSSNWHYRVSLNLEWSLSSCRLENFFASRTIFVNLRKSAVTSWRWQIPYRQPGLLCTPQNFPRSSKFLGNFYFGTKVTSEALLSIFQNLKVARLQGGTETKLRTCWRNFDLSRSFECFFFCFFLGLFMSSLCSSRWSDQKCCITKCVALKTGFRPRPMWAL